MKIDDLDVNLLYWWLHGYIQPRKISSALHTTNFLNFDCNKLKTWKALVRLYMLNRKQVFPQDCLFLTHLLCPGMG